MKGRITKTGYRRNSPDVGNDFNIIPSNRISMKGVDFPVLGIDNLGNTQLMHPGGEYEYQGDYVTELPMYGSGGLTQWFAEEWVDIKTGKKCGRSGKDKKGRPYPACRPSKRVNSTTPKTASELSAAEKAKFKRKKKSGKRIDYNHKRAQLGIEVPQRNGVRKNPDGSVSTHLMATETLDGKNWFSFPTLFQDPDGTWIDMSDRPWKEAYEEAKRRDELIEFGTDEEAAIKFGEGSWKLPKAQERNGETPLTRKEVFNVPRTMAYEDGKMVVQDKPIWDGFLDEVTITPYTSSEIAWQENRANQATGGLEPVYPIFEVLSAGMKTPFTAGAKALQTGVRKAPSVINPRYFKPNSNMYYRGIGKEGMEDALQSGLFRAKPADQIPARMVDLGSVGKVDMAKRFNNTYYSPQFGIADRYGAGYIAEVPKDIANFRKRYKGSDWSMATKDQIPISEGQILKKDWWHGYKPVKQTGGSLPSYQTRGEVRKTPLDKFFETAPKGIKIESLVSDDNGMDVYTMSDGTVIKQKRSQTMHYPYDAGAIEKVYNDKAQYENAMKAFSDSLSLANFSSDGMFPEYDPDWARPMSMANTNMLDNDEVIKARSNLARKIEENSKGSIKGYYPGDEPGYWEYGQWPILRWGDDPNKKLDGNYRGQDLGYYGLKADHDPYKRTNFSTGIDLMYNENTKDFRIPVDTYESHSVPMGQGNFLRRTYTNARGDQQVLLDPYEGGDWLETGKIIQTVNEAGRENLDQGYHRVAYPSFPPPKVRPVYRQPVTRVSLPPKTARLPIPEVNLQIKDPLPKFYGRDMNRYGDIIYDTSFGQFVTTKDQNRLNLLRSNGAGSRYKNNMSIDPMLDQDFQNLFRNRIDQGVRSQRGQFSENIDVIRARANKKAGGELPKVQKGNGEKYTVASGDTYYSIANKLNMKPEDLIKLNPGIEPTALQIGQSIITGIGATEATPQVKITDSTSYKPEVLESDLNEVRRNALRAAIDSVAGNQLNMNQLLTMSSAMENDYGYNPNAYERTSTFSPMSLDSIARVDLFEPRGEAGRYTSSQAKYREWFKEINGYYPDPKTMEEKLSQDDELAAVSAARMMYGRVTAPLPKADDKKAIFDYYYDHYNKAGAKKYGSREEDYERFLSWWDKIYGEADKKMGGENIPVYNTYKTKNRAWLAARKNLGANKKFMYGGKVYSTSTPKGL